VPKRQKIAELLEKTDLNPAKKPCVFIDFMSDVALGIPINVVAKASRDKGSITTKKVIRHLAKPAMKLTIGEKTR
jgi:hypothetical protein